MTGDILTPPFARSPKRYPIVLTGITGHVGGELARQLVAAGAEVHGLTRQALPIGRPSLNQVTLHKFDSRTETLVELFRELRPHTVIHLAALARRNHLTSDIVPFVEANILYGLQLLEAMRLSDCRRFVTTESILQYSDTGEYSALNLYAATKQSFADLLIYYVRAFDLSAIALVVPTVYSEHETAPKLMTDAAGALQHGTVLNLQADDVQIDFVHVEDVANAFVRAASLLESIVEPTFGSLSRYFVSSGRTVTPTELLALFERIGEKKMIVRRKPASHAGLRRVRPWFGPVLPGWVPYVDLESGIKRMLSRQQ